jgi:hypothetical protein
MPKYISRYSPDKDVTPAQYITELICEKKAAQQDSELPIQFWKLPEWKSYYQFQIMLANKLVKKFPSDAIVRALMDSKAKRYYSLGHPGLKDLIKIHIKPDPEPYDASDLKSTLAKPINRKSKSILTKLRD